MVPGVTVMGYVWTDAGRGLGCGGQEWSVRTPKENYLNRHHDERLLRERLLPSGPKQRTIITRKIITRTADRANYYYAKDYYPEDHERERLLRGARELRQRNLGRGAHNGQRSAREQDRERRSADLGHHTNRRGGRVYSQRPSDQGDPVPRLVAAGRAGGQR